MEKIAAWAERLGPCNNPIGLSTCRDRIVVILRAKNLKNVLILDKNRNLFLFSHCEFSQGATQLGNSKATCKIWTGIQGKSRMVGTNFASRYSSTCGFPLGTEKKHCAKFAGAIVERSDFSSARRELMRRCTDVTDGHTAKLSYIDEVRGKAAKPPGFMFRKFARVLRRQNQAWYKCLGWTSWPQKSQRFFWKLNWTKSSNFWVVS